MANLRSLFSRLLNGLLPVNCAGCGAPLETDPVPFFCRACWAEIKPLPTHACPRCDRPFVSAVALSRSPRHHCGACRTKPPAFSRAWTRYAYEPPLKEAICQFKYHGKTSLAEALAQLMVKAMSPPADVDVIIPVPLHSSRLREREYNQALLLADCLGTHFRLPVQPNVLVRIRPNPPQTTLKRKDRLKNLRRSFIVTNPARIEGKTVLLVDDVFTTGTTANECAKMLRKAGSGPVYVGTVARMI